MEHEHGVVKHLNSSSISNVSLSGTQTAYAWVRCGYRTLDDLRAVESSLTRNQRIGLRYYDELLDRMPRAEAAEIEAVVTRLLAITITKPMSPNIKSNQIKAHL